MKIYLISGWFGDRDWIEEVHANKENADARCNELWTTRRSNRPIPQYIQGVCKFAVEEWDVIE
jgi:hypothetical protein